MDWWTRTRVWVVSGLHSLTRSLDPSRTLEDFNMGADFASEPAVQPGYSHENALSAMAAFPWVRAAVLAKCEDIAGLPVVVRATKRGKAMESHPLLELVDDPGGGQQWECIVRQMVVDLELAGNAYLVPVVTRMAGMVGASVLRLHPSRIEPVASENGLIGSYRHTQTHAVWPVDAVVHTRHVSWEDGVIGLLGEGHVRSLHQSLTADLEVQKQTAKAAKRGRLETVFSPDDMLGKKQLTDFKKKYEAFAQGGGGAMVLNQGMTVTPISVSARDMEFIESRTMSRSETLAVFSVPPVRVGLEVANYATAVEQMRVYWTHLSALCRLLNGALTRLARCIAGDKVVAEFDLSGVPWLQSTRNAQYERALLLVQLGALPSEALEFEGVEGAPVDDSVLAIDSPPADTTTPEEEPADPQGTDEGEDKAWKLFEQRVHTPSRKEIERAVTAYLIESRDGYLERIRRAGQGLSPHKGISDSLADILDPTGEARRMRDRTSRALQRTVHRGFARIGRLVGADLDDSSVFSAARSVIEATVVRAARFTVANIEAVIRRAIGAGLGVDDILALVKGAAAFTVGRVKRIAITATTLALNSGADEAFKAAKKVGIPVKVRWLTEQDGRVRAAHRPMHGQEVEPGEPFKAPGGQTAHYPGGFGVAALDINCRCGTIPVVSSA